MHNPSAYWRSTTEWKQWLGRQGVVIAQTTVHVAAPELADATPYSYVIVDFGDERREYMGADHQHLSVGDRVECVLRKLSNSSKEALIPYGIKVTKVRS